MAYTQAQLDALKQAYASGVLTVKTGNDQTTFRSLDEMERLIASIERSLNNQTRKSTVVGCYRKF